MDDPSHPIHDVINNVEHVFAHLAASIVFRIGRRRSIIFRNYISFDSEFFLSYLSLSLSFSFYPSLSFFLSLFHPHVSRRTHTSISYLNPDTSLRAVTFSQVVDFKFSLSLSSFLSISLSHFFEAASKLF